MAQVGSICACVSQITDVHRREPIQVELRQRDGNIALLRADLEALGQSARQSVSTIAATTRRIFEQAHVPPDKEEFQVATSDFVERNLKPNIDTDTVAKYMRPGRILQPSTSLPKDG